MTVTEDISYQTLEHELAQAIRKYRDDCPPEETARVLLTYDAVPNRLVGITAHAEHAIFADQHGTYVVTAAFDSHGPKRKHGLVIAEFESRRAQHDWISGKHQSYWEWLHPRYREREAESK